MVIPFTRKTDTGFLLTTRNRRALEILEDICIPFDYTRREWILKSYIYNEKDKYKGQDCYIIGKGPSSKYLREEHIGAGPVIALNHASIKLDTLNLKNDLYCAQCDAHKIGEDCWLHNGTMLLSNKARNIYKTHHSVIHIIPTAVGCRHKFKVTLELAIYVSKFWGCKKQVFISCDALTKGDLTYASYIGYEQYNPLLLKTKQVIEELCSDYEHITPEEMRTQV